MKTMKFFMMVALALLMAACNNDSSDMSAWQTEKAQGIPFTATIETDNSAETRTIVMDEGTTVSSTWETGDEIALIYKVGNNSYNTTATVQYVMDGKAYITATLEDRVTNGTPLTIIYPASAADGTTGNIRSNLLAEQNGALRNNSDGTILDVRKGTGIVSLVGDNAVMGSATKLKAQYAITKFMLGEQINSTTPLYIKSGTTDILPTIITVKPTNNTNVVYVAMEPATSKKYRFESITKTNKLLKKSTATIQAGKFYQTTIEVRYPLPMADVDENEDIGTIITSDGLVYMNPIAVSAASKKGEAMVAFIGQIDCVHGIALALHDSDALGHYGAGTFYWSRAHDLESSSSPIPHWIANHPISGATWRLPSKTDWQVMMLGCRLETDAIARADVMEPVKGFKEKLDVAGASLGGDYGFVYWTGDGDEGHKQWVEFDFYSGGTFGASFNINGEWGGQPNYTRLCLSF
jgi:hypothetical protein